MSYRAFGTITGAQCATQAEKAAARTNCAPDTFVNIAAGTPGLERFAGEKYCGIASLPDCPPPVRVVTTKFGGTCPEVPIPSCLRDDEVSLVQYCQQYGSQGPVPVNNGYCSAFMCDTAVWGQLQAVPPCDAPPPPEEGGEKKGMSTGSILLLVLLGGGTLYWLSQRKKGGARKKNPRRLSAEERWARLTPAERSAGMANWEFVGRSSRRSRRASTGPGRRKTRRRR